MYEHEYWELVCTDCKIKVKVRTNIQRGFSDHEEVSCPICNKSLGEIRADMGFDIIMTESVNDKSADSI